MITSLLAAATAAVSGTSLIIEGCVTYISIWGIAKGVKHAGRTNYSFKH